MVDFVRAYLCSLLDGYSRVLVHWEFREWMTEPDLATILQRAREKHPEGHPRIISDNGPQSIAKDFKEFVRLAGMSHVRTSPYYPQSHGKPKRWHQTLRVTMISPQAPGALAEARRMTAAFVAHYNTQRLHRAFGHLTPAVKLRGREQKVWAARDRQLEAARERRRQHHTGIARMAVAL